MKILILAEHNNQTLRTSTLHTIAAAQKISGDIDILVAGNNCGLAADAAGKIPGIGKVLKADNPALANEIAENIAPLIVQAVKANNYSHVLAPGNTFGKNILPRAAALLDSQQISDIIAVESPDTFRRPVYGGQAIATVRSSDAVKCITVRTTAFDKVPTTGGNATITDLTGASDFGQSKFIRLDAPQSTRPELANARIVVSGGRALGSAENFKIIEALADKLGAAIGASRAAVDAGYISNDYQVGQTGKAVAPDLYIAIGISGAIQHLAGMMDSKIIVAINKDEDAPIFKIADYGLVGDLFTIIPELKEKL